MALPPWMIGKAVSNPEGTGKLLRNIVIGIVILVVILFGIGTELLSAFQGNIIDDTFDVYSIQVYEDAMKIQLKFHDELNEQMKEMEKQLIEENTYTVTNNDGTTSEECDISVSRKVNDPNISYILAYINYTDVQVHRWKNTTLKEDQILDFLYSMTEIKVSDRIDDVYYIWNDILSAEDVADIYFSDNSLNHEMYLASFDLYVSFLDHEGIVTDESWTYINGELQQEAVTHDTGMAVPQYYQTNFPNVRYGNGTIASSGCAPTSIAMMVSYLTGQTVTPVDVVNWAGNRYYVSGQGSSWSIFGAAAKNYGIGCSNLGRSQSGVLAALEAGKPVVASMGKGTFTKGGHFIVLRGVTADGYFLVNDPNKKNVDKYKTDRFETGVVFKEAKNFWSFG